MSDAGRWTTLLAAVFVVLSAPPAVAAAERQTIGFIEDILLFPGRIPFKAKIDSGANTSSLDVADIQEFDRDGKSWVRFQLVLEDGRWVGFESPVVRMSTIRRAGTDAERRPVVKFGICLGRHYAMAEVNLYDRTDMSHRMLIGRRFLGGMFLIDTSAKNLTKPDCPGAPRS
jgi:hypothetical protein